MSQQPAEIDRIDVPSIFGTVNSWLPPCSGPSLTAGRTGKWGLGPLGCGTHLGFEMDLRLTGMDLITLAPGGENANLHTTTSTDQRSLGPFECFINSFRRKNPVHFCTGFPSLLYQVSRTKIVYHLSCKSSSVCAF